MIGFLNIHPTATKITTISHQKDFVLNSVQASGGLTLYRVTVLTLLLPFVSVFVGTSTGFGPAYCG